MENLIEILLVLLLISSVLTLFAIRTLIKTFGTTYIALQSQLEGNKKDLLKKIETENSKLIETLNTVTKLD